MSKIIITKEDVENDVAKFCTFECPYHAKCDQDKKTCETRVKLTNDLIDYWKSQNMYKEK